MIELVYRIDPADEGAVGRPATPAEAKAALENGNESFVHLLDTQTIENGVLRKVMNVRAADIGYVGEESPGLTQEPFALVLGCADARAPIELVFNQGANDLFVLRVAGNVLGQEVLGSVDYALQHLPTIQLLVVLGHSHCGAITAAVNAFLEPAAYLGLSTDHQLRSIVNQLFPAVRLGHQSMIEVWGTDAERGSGFVAGLIETAAALNAALMASSLQADLDMHLRQGIKAVFSIYDLETRSVDVSGLGDADDLTSQLFEPPNDSNGFESMGLKLAASPVVASLMQHSV